MTFSMAAFPAAMTAQQQGVPGGCGNLVAGTTPGMGDHFMAAMPRSPPGRLVCYKQPCYPEHDQADSGQSLVH